MVNMTIVGRRVLHCKHLLKCAHGSQPGYLTLCAVLQRRHFFKYFHGALNSPDVVRIKMEGPDLVCAEWVLKCGGKIKWKGRDKWIKNFKELPSTNDEDLRVEEIDGSESSVMGVGFFHLDGLEHLRRMTLRRCRYLNDNSLEYLPFVKDSLTYLDIASCPKLSDTGVLHLVEMSNLKHLRLYEMMGMTNKAECYKLLKEALPQCNIDFPDVFKEKALDSKK